MTPALPWHVDLPSDVRALMKRLLQQRAEMLFGPGTHPTRYIAGRRAAGTPTGTLYEELRRDAEALLARATRRTTPSPSTTPAEEAHS